MGKLQPLPFSGSPAPRFIRFPFPSLSCLVQRRGVAGGTRGFWGPPPTYQNSRRALGKPLSPPPRLRQRFVPIAPVESEAITPPHNRDPEIIPRRRHWLVHSAHGHFPTFISLAAPDSPHGSAKPMSQPLATQTLPRPSEEGDLNLLRLKQIT